MEALNDDDDDNYHYDHCYYYNFPWVRLIMHRIIKHVTGIKDLTYFLHIATLKTQPVPLCKIILHNEVALWQIVTIERVEWKRPI